MKIELIATGDEILTGALTDTNSSWLAEVLQKTGGRVDRHVTVGDTLSKLSEQFQETALRADVAIVTGGLGPTTDDLTAEAMAQATGCPLVFNSEVLQTVEAFFKRLNRPMSASNRKQALLPKGAIVLPNPVGTAPGFSIRLKRCTFFCLPGVPPEMKRMFHKSVLPAIAEQLKGGATVNLLKMLTVFGIPESLAGEKAAAVISGYSELKLGLRASFPVLQIKLYCHGKAQKKITRQLEEASKRMADAFGDAVFSTSTTSMAEAVSQILVERGSSVAVAESCTGGLISHWLTNISGSSDFFHLGAVTYANEAKADILGVLPDMLAQKGAVSLEVVRQMAAGIKARAGTDYGIATSGIAGPTGGTAEKPAGTVCIGLASPNGVWTRRYCFAIGGRGMKKKLFATTALDQLRRCLLGLHPGILSGYPLDTYRQP